MRQQPISQILRATAERLAVQLDYRDGIYFLGEARPDARALLVRKVARLNQDDLAKAIQPLLTTTGKQSTFADGLIVVSDSTATLSQVSKALDQVEAADNPVWAVQFYLVSLSDTDMKNLGFDITPTANIAASFAAASTGAPTGAANASLGLSAVLNTATSHNDNRSIYEPLMLLADGQNGTVKRVEAYPVPNSNVSQNGTVSNTNYQYVDIGVTVTATIRERSRSSAFINLQVTNNTIQGYVNNVPITNGDSLTSAAIVNDGGTYLMGQLDATEDDRRLPTWLQWGSLYTKTRRIMQVWMTARLIAGPANGV